VQITNAVHKVLHLIVGDFIAPIAVHLEV